MIDRVTVPRTSWIEAITLRPGLFITLVAVACALALLTVFYAFSPEPVRVEVDLSVSDGTSIALWVNDLTRRPMTQPLVPGGRRTYVFDGVVEDITMLRVDPADAGGATVDLHSIAVVGRGGILALFGPRALAGWTAYELALTGVDDIALHLRTSAPYSFLMAATAIPLVRKAGAWTRWLPMVNTPDMAWWLAAISLVLLLVVASVDPARRFQLPVAGFAVGLVMLILAVRPSVPDGPASAAVAVSRATFMGLSTRPALLGSIAMFIGAALIGSAAALLDRRRNDLEHPSVPAMRVWHVIGGLVAIALVTSPGLREQASVISTHQFVPSWDSDNVSYWAYLVHEGKLPFRDFWYPYGGFFVFDLPFPAGLLLRWLYESILFGVFFAALGKWRGVSLAFAGTALLLLGQRLGLLPGTDRYLLGVNIVLAYLTVDRESPGASTRVLFWCSCGLALLFDPPQLLYAGVPVALIAAAGAARCWGTNARMPVDLSRRLYADFGVPVAMAAVLSALLLMSGQFRGFMGFYGRLGDSVAYSAWPTGLPELAMTGFPRALLVFSCCAIVLAIGAYEYCAGGVRRAYGEALTGVGLLSLMVLQKHFARWIDEQLLLLVAVCVMVLGAGWPGRRRVLDLVAGGVILGAVTSMLVEKPTSPPVPAAIFESSTRALSDLAFLASDRAVAASANAARFAPQRFDQYASERQVSDWLRSHPGRGGDVRVFALTDDPILYVLARQPPVWVSTLYSASPVYEQARMVRWLRTERPPYVVLDPDRLMLDGFQKAVRVPLVFDEVIDTYVPIQVLGRLDILRRRWPAEPLAMSYWRERLGSDVDVGRVASVSSFTSSAGCSSACGDLLEVEMPVGGRGRVSVPVTASDLSFFLTFTRVPEETAYRVLLDRVWFWDVAKRAGLPHAVTGAASPGMRIRVRAVPLEEDVLY